eukprot:365676-Chlamydomonas_euryale.AAC.13
MRKPTASRKDLCQPVLELTCATKDRQTVRQCAWCRQGPGALLVQLLPAGRGSSCHQGTLAWSRICWQGSSPKKRKVQRLAMARATPRRVTPLRIGPRRQRVSARRAANAHRAARPPRARPPDRHRAAGRAAAAADFPSEASPQDTAAAASRHRHTCGRAVAGAGAAASV